MREIKANIWDRQFDECWRVIPINCQVKKNGKLVMGAGLAKQAAERYANLSKFLGMSYKNGYTGLDPYSKEKLLAFPTKYSWKDDSYLELIELNLKSLFGLVRDGFFDRIVCPRLGCGLGKLDWETQVKPMMEKYFHDNDNFVIVYQ